MKNVLAAAFVLAAVSASAQTSPPAQTPQASPTKMELTPLVRNLTRVENWSFFEPRPGGGDPEYTFIANRLLAGLRHSGPRHELNGSVQYVQFGGLPDQSIGPGALGTGANYYDHNRRTDSRQVYLKSLNLLVRHVVPGLNVRVGRMPYASGGETVSGNAGIEAVKRMRIDSRLIGEFEWSIYQRAFDGVRADYTYDRVQFTGAALWPTQGGFEEKAGSNLKDVRLLSGVATLKPSIVLSHTEVQAFVHHYDDERPVTGRPDNSGRPISRADVSFFTSGAHVVGAYPSPGGRADVMVWGALQHGDWYESRQRAWAVAVEAGYQWTATWSPWVRAGWNRASGDDDPVDMRHGTFMPPMPTGRKYSLSTVYTFMNLDDLFVQGIVRPRANVSIRADLHKVTLAERADRWYAGSGATRRTGVIFGYAGRASGGADDLGTVIEGSVDWTISRRWSVNGYAGRMFGGDVVRNLFAGDRLTFLYAENVIQF